MGPLLGRVHVGVRFKAQVHHHGDGPGLLGAAHLSRGLMDQRSKRSLPNKAVDVVACQTFSRSLVFRVLNSCPAFRSRRSELSCRLAFRGYAAAACSIAPDTL